MLPMLQVVVRVIIAYVLCLNYSVIVGFRLCMNYLLNYKAKPWQQKERREPPNCLQDPKYGRHQFVTVNNVKLHYVEAGDPSKPLMLFVHGFPEFWYSWRHQITEFSKDYWTIALDLRGYGDSEKPPNATSYKVKNLVEDIQAFIVAMNRKKCVLVCHDWGAIIGWSFVATHKHMVDKYIMMGAPSSKAWIKSLQTTFDQFSKSWYVFFFQMPLLPELAMASNDLQIFEKMNDSTFTEYFTEEDLEAFKYTFSKPDALKYPIDYYRTNFSLFEPKSAQKRDEEDGANGMYVLGQRDHYISHASCLILPDMFPMLRVEVVPNANHFVQQHDPNAVNKLMRDFLGHASDFSVEPIE